MKRGSDCSDSCTNESTWSWNPFTKRPKQEVVEVGYQLLGEKTARLTALCAQHPELDSKAIDIVFVGLESAGKSSLLQRYLKLDQLPTAKRKCTTVPFEINLHHDESLAESKATLEGKSFTESDLQLKNRPQLDDTPVRIDVRGPELPNMTFIDTPGVFEARNGDETCAEVAISKAIAGGYIDRPHSVIVLVADVSIPLRLNSVWDMLKGKLVAGRAMVAFTHADKASEAILQERLDELAESVTGQVPKSVVLSNQCRTLSEEQRLLSQPSYAAAKRRGLAAFNFALAEIIDDANNSVIPNLVRHVGSCKNATQQQLRDIGPRITKANLTAVQTHLRELLLPKMVAALCCNLAAPPSPPRPTNVPDFLIAAAHRRLTMSAFNIHYQQVFNHMIVDLKATLSGVKMDISEWKLGRFDDLMTLLVRRVDDIIRKGNLPQRTRSLDSNSSVSLAAVPTIAAGFILDIHHLLLEIDFNVPIEIVQTENAETIHLRSRLDATVVRLRELVTGLELLLK